MMGCMDKDRWVGPFQPEGQHKASGILAGEGYLAQWQRLSNVCLPKHVRDSKKLLLQSVSSL